MVVIPYTQHLCYRYYPVCFHPVWPARPLIVPLSSLLFWVDNYRRSKGSNVQLARSAYCGEIFHFFPFSHRNKDKNRPNVHLQFHGLQFHWSYWWPVEWSLPSERLPALCLCSGSHLAHPEVRDSLRTWSTRIEDRLDFDGKPSNIGKNNIVMGFEILTWIKLQSRGPSFSVQGRHSGRIFGSSLR